jgi:peptidoglycan/xylan/chitin deacetylase (PgdA/CDA1 family)
VSAFDGLVLRSEWDRMESRVCRNTERLLDLFSEFARRRRSSSLGWVAERFPALVRTIAERGHEIASHGYAHRLIYDQTPAAFRTICGGLGAVLEDAGGRRVGGLSRAELLDHRADRSGPSIFSSRRATSTTPASSRSATTATASGVGRGSLSDRPACLGRSSKVPGSTARVGPLNLPIGGGGVLPASSVRLDALGHRPRETGATRVPTVFYLHPWEIDPDQPRLPAWRLSRFRHYRHLADTESRLRRLLADFRFGPIEQLVADVRLALGDEGHAAALPYAW